MHPTTNTTTLFYRKYISFCTNAASTRKLAPYQREDLLQYSLWPYQFNASHGQLLKLHWLRLSLFVKGGNVAFTYHFNQSDMTRMQLDWYANMVVRQPLMGASHPCHSSTDILTVDVP